ncbi:MAG: 4Fe-4S dicluster domain-containing protein [Coriobacteriales bacterium]|nr:4Fe-4S dicluster domain-containing protein [Coriobacteriales bacterium]
MADKQFGMVIDTTVCVGCQTCVVGCNINHELPSDTLWAGLMSFDGDVLYQSTGIFPQTQLKFRPTLCNHCSNPACVAACPTGAMAKDPETGIVSPDAEVCIGCSACVEACPYGAPVINFITGKSSKCTFCMERSTEGYEPYCVAACPANARIFGDLNDPQSEVAQLVAAGAMPWNPEANTEPNVYYIA